LTQLRWGVVTHHSRIESEQSRDVAELTRQLQQSVSVRSHVDNRIHQLRTRVELSESGDHECDERACAPSAVTSSTSASRRNKPKARENDLPSASTANNDCFVPLHRSHRGVRQSQDRFVEPLLRSGEVFPHTQPDMPHLLGSARLSSS